MCGINGIYSKKPIDKIGIRIQKMNDAVSHRGPDADGTLIINERVVLGHRRLSIIDVNSRANQPMVSNSGRWTIVFNGEIYNYKELRREVNYKFRSNSDTEVILAYIENYGIDDFIKKCNGMYAIALYDNIVNKLYILRDRLGVKPLYYTISNDCFIFSSEIKGILNSGLVKAEFNEDAIDEYLGNRYVRAPYTFFTRINQLEAGCFLVVDSDLNINKIVYWELPDEFNYDIQYDEQDIADQFEKELSYAIKSRLVTDVPLGTYLSGGLDSSLITAITSRVLQKSIDTYTIGFNDLNEFSYAEKVANKYKTQHHRIILEPDDYFNSMNKIIQYKDAPLSVPNEIALAYMSKVLKETITVVLSGEGADELLGGYGKIFRSPFDFENLNGIKGEFYDYFINRYEYVPRKLRDKHIKTKKTLRDYYDNLIREEFNAKRNEENVFRFFHKYHVKGLLLRVDATTMLAGVEARVPFLDYKLIEFSYKHIPYDLKLRWKNETAKEQAKKLSSNVYSEKLDIPKYILKKVGYKYLPKDVIEREKMGFPVPLNHWISRLENNAQTILKDAYWLKSEMIDDLIKESKMNQRAGQIIWMFINIELFRRHYFNKNWLY